MYQRTDGEFSSSQTYAGTRTTYPSDRGRALLAYNPHKERGMDVFHMKFPHGSIDKHNISMGFYDPVEAAQSGDPLWGGNAPYRIEGLWAGDRLSPEYTSLCSISVPDYVNGSDGTPGSPVAARADTGPGGDMRLGGCPQVS